MQGVYRRVIISPTPLKWVKLTSVNKCVMYVLNAMVEGALKWAVRNNKTVLLYK